ncbi:MULTISPECIES: hypothetical protein [unclassified Pantoea]|nr:MULTISPECIES: hypothetical protein [unclassified Pantoea]MCA1178610.1 hypothetical protein [Pantoea sp. alder69]MCA1252028.1 hypothetical protein [Pantoea sp. alder70]MCA1267099.1 hypothetical protein [Pantoea sp. alder81]
MNRSEVVETLGVALARYLQRLSSLPVIPDAAAKWRFSQAAETFADDRR